MFAEHFELPLNGAQIAVKACVFELPVQLAGRDFAATRDATQQLDGEQYGFEGVRAFGHVKASMQSQKR